MVLDHAVQDLARLFVAFGERVIGGEVSGTHRHAVPPAQRVSVDQRSSERPVTSSELRYDVTRRARDGAADVKIDD